MYIKSGRRLCCQIYKGGCLLLLRSVSLLINQFSISIKNTPLFHFLLHSVWFHFSSTCSLPFYFLHYPFHQFCLKKSTSNSLLFSFRFKIKNKFLKPLPSLFISLIYKNETQILLKRPRPSHP